MRRLERVGPRDRRRRALRGGGPASHDREAGAACPDGAGCGRRRARGAGPVAALRGLAPGVDSDAHPTGRPHLEERLVPRLDQGDDYRSSSSWSWTDGSDDGSPRLSGRGRHGFRSSWSATGERLLLAGLQPGRRARELRAAALPQQRRRALRAGLAARDGVLPDAVGRGDRGRDPAAGHGGAQRVGAATRCSIAGSASRRSDGCVTASTRRGPRRAGLGGHHHAVRRSARPACSSRGGSPSRPWAGSHVGFDYGYEDVDLGLKGCWPPGAAACAADGRWPSTTSRPPAQRLRPPHALSLPGSSAPAHDPLGPELERDTRSNESGAGASGAARPAAVAIILGPVTSGRPGRRLGDALEQEGWQPAYVERAAPKSGGRAAEIDLLLIDRHGCGGGAAVGGAALGLGGGRCPGLLQRALAGPAGRAAGRHAGGGRGPSPGRRRLRSRRMVIGVRAPAS